MMGLCYDRRVDMDPARINADRVTAAAFYGSRPLLYDGTRRSVSVSAWLYDMEMIFYTCHIEDRLQVSLASRCLIADSRLWWMTFGEGQMPSRTRAHFRAGSTCAVRADPCCGVR